MADLRLIQTDGTVKVTGHLDRRWAEALALELRAVARRYGLEVQCAGALSDEVPDGEVCGGSHDSTQ
jgi:hypothetical protein